MNHDYSSYSEGETILEKEIAHQNAKTFQLCIDAWNHLHSGLIKSIDRQIPLFMPFKQQVDIGCFCAIRSLVHLHGQSYHQNFRYALENIAICIYHLVHPEKFNELFLKKATKKDEGEFAKAAKTQGYKLIKNNYPILNKALNAMKEMTNDYGAHATFSSTVANTKLGKQIYETNLFDTTTKFLLDARFLSLADAMIAFAKTIMTEKWDPNMLLLHESTVQKLDFLAQRWQVLQKITLGKHEQKIVQK